MTLREISLTLPNRPGALAGIARALARERINLAAISVDSSSGKGRVRLIVNDPDRATSLLRSAGYEVEVREMIAVRLEDRAGSFLRVLEMLAKERINIQSVAILVAREGSRDPGGPLDERPPPDPQAAAPLGGREPRGGTAGLERRPPRDGPHDPLGVGRPSPLKRFAQTVRGVDPPGWVARLWSSG